MKNRFVKNMFQVLSCFASEIIIGIPILIVGFETGFRNRDANLFMVICIVFLIVLPFGIGSYWIFQNVVIDKNGISVYLFGRKVRYASWGSIEAIKRAGVMRNMCYVISILDEEKTLNLDYRKSIKKAMLFYAPPSIVEIIKNIP